MKFLYLSSGFDSHPSYIFQVRKCGNVMFLLLSTHALFLDDGSSVFLGKPPLMRSQTKALRVVTCPRPS